MKTRMTEMLGIKHPIMLAGMGSITQPKLVAAVSNAGGLGVLASSGHTADSFRKAIREVRGLTDKPFGVNIALAAAERRPHVPVAFEEKVPVYNYSLSRPPDVEKIVKSVHEYGGKVIGTVTMKRHAVRAEQLGVDMLSITGLEAALHAGNIGTFVIVPAITDVVKIPCICAGGNTDGKSLAAALALGAEGITMGLRFACSVESDVPDTIKQAWLKATEEDTVFDTVFDGMGNRQLMNKAAEEMLRKHPPVIHEIWTALYMKRKARLSFSKLISVLLSMRGQRTRVGGEASWAQRMRSYIYQSPYTKAIETGDPVDCLVGAGQGVGRIDDIITVAEAMERTVAQAEAILGTLKERFSS